MATRMDLPIPAWANRSTLVRALRNGTLKPHRKLSNETHRVDALQPFGNRVNYYCPMHGQRNLVIFLGKSEREMSSGCVTLIGRFKRNISQGFYSGSATA